MTPDERTALKRAGLATLAMGWLIWMAGSISREAALCLAVAWLFMVGWLLEGKG